MSRRNSQVPISVVLPVRNGEAYLGNALTSISEQTCKEWELIVIDDGSTDSTPRILEEHAGRDPRLRIHRTEAAGIIGALNLGLETARGTLIARMDADDWAAPGRLERQFEAFEARRDLVALGCQIRRIDATGCNLGKGRYPVGSALCRKQLLFSSPLCHPAVMMRADVVRQVSGYRQSYRYAEDYDLWLRLGELGEIDNLDEMLLDYRVHATSVTTQYGHIQAVSSALARLAADFRTRGETDPTPEWSWHGETIGEVCDRLRLASGDRMRTVLAYWRALVLSCGSRDHGALHSFCEELPELVDFATAIGETKALAVLTLRAGNLARKAGLMLMSARCVAYSAYLSPGATAADLADRIGVGTAPQ